MTMVRPRKPLPELDAHGRLVVKAAPPPPPLARWNVLTTEQLAEELPPVNWMCEPLGIAPGAITLVAGYGYSRKTMALQSLGLSVAAGKPVWGLWSCRKGPFVHIDYEQGRRLTQERYQRLARGMGFDLRDLPAGSLRAAVLPHAYLDEPNLLDEVCALVGDASFVLVDSLRAAFPHADENSSEVRGHLDMLSRVSERTGAAIAVIHHARKPSAMNGGTSTHAIRGSSALFDACQSVFVFEGEKGSPTKVHHQKDRVRGACLDDFGLDAEDVADGPDPRWGLRVLHLDAAQMVADDPLAGLKKTVVMAVRKARSPVVSATEIFEIVGGRKAAVLRAVRELLRDGTLSQPGGEETQILAPRGGGR